jgi:hypothetical protein
MVTAGDTGKILILDEWLVTGPLTSDYHQYSGATSRDAIGGRRKRISAPLHLADGAKQDLHDRCKAGKGASRACTLLHSKGLVKSGTRG